MAFEQKPNAGNLWKNKFKKTGDTQPYFKGVILLDKTFLKNIMNETEGETIQISASAWTGKTKNDEPYLSLQISEVINKPALPTNDDDVPEWMR